MAAALITFARAPALKRGPRGGPRAGPITLLVTKAEVITITEMTGRAALAAEGPGVGPARRADAITAPTKA